MVIRMQIARFPLVVTFIYPQWSGVLAVLLLLFAPLAAQTQQKADPCPKPVCEGKRGFRVHPEPELPKPHCGAFENVASQPKGEGVWECSARLAEDKKTCKYRFRNGMWRQLITEQGDKKRQKKAEENSCPAVPPSVCGPGEVAFPAEQRAALHKQVYDILLQRPDGKQGQDACDCNALNSSTYCVGNCAEKPHTYRRDRVDEVRARLTVKDTCQVVISYDVSFECTGTCAP